MDAGWDVLRSTTNHWNKNCYGIALDVGANVKTVKSRREHRLDRFLAKRDGYHLD